MFTVKTVKTDYYDIGMHDAFAIELELLDEAKNAFYVMLDQFCNETHATVSKESMIHAFNNRKAYHEAVHQRAMERLNFGKDFDASDLLTSKFQSAISVGTYVLRDFVKVADNDSKVARLVTGYTNLVLNNQPCIL